MYKCCYMYSYLGAIYAKGPLRFESCSLCKYFWNELSILKLIILIKYPFVSKMFFLVRLFQVTLVLVVKLSGIWAFSEGPPLSTCEYMFAYHRIRGRVPRTYNQAQTGESPYNISVSNSSYSAGENLTVTISGAITFNGFILQAQGTNSSVAWPVGEFVRIPSGTYYSLFLSAVERDKLSRCVTYHAICNYGSFVLHYFSRKCRYSGITTKRIALSWPWVGPSLFLTSKLEGSETNPTTYGNPTRAI